MNDTIVELCWDKVGTLLVLTLKKSNDMFLLAGKEERNGLFTSENTLAKSQKTGLIS
jgi:hypothetical protein